MSPIRWLGAIALGVFLWALAMPLQAVLEWLRLSAKDQSFLHAIALIVIILLCILIFRRPVTPRRPVAPPPRTDDEED
jgi:hypothetical protein